MNFRLMMRSRPDGPIPAKHERFLSCLAELKSDWGLIGTTWPDAKDPGTLPMQQVKLSKCFTKGIKANVSYQNRKYVRDEGQFDDYFTLEFDPKQVDYLLLVKYVFQVYLDAFGAYRGQIGDEAFIYLDFEASRHVDLRHGVFRVLPVSFFDRELCVRSYGLEPGHIANRVTPWVESVSLRSDGILIVGTSQVISFEEAKAMTDRLALAIRGE